MYIQIPSPPPKPIALLQGKPLGIKPAKRDEVPENYRKKRIRDHLSEILLYVVGFEYYCKNIIRKGINTMIDDRNAAVPVRKMSFKEYKKRKLKMLRRDFRISLTEEELAHADTLTTEVQVDQFCLGILNKRWG